MRAKEINYGRSLLISKEEKIMHIGESEDFAMCKSTNCPGFVNKKYSELCELHKKEEEGKRYQMIRSSRANLRSDFVDSNHL